MHDILNIFELRSERLPPKMKKTITAALVKTAEILKDKGNYNAAAKVLTVAVKIDPNSLS